MYNLIGLKIKSTPFCHYSALQKSHGGGNLGNNIFLNWLLEPKLSDPEISTMHHGQFRSSSNTFTWASL
jgi:hypothetical protein